MKSADTIANDLLRRLLAGERGVVPSHLGLLLERSSPGGHDDDHYRQLLPAELVTERLSSETITEIVARLCEEASRNPDIYLVSTCAATRAEVALRTIARILINPPRLLTLWESAIALSYLAKDLPRYVKKDPQFLPKTELGRLNHLIKDLGKLEAGERDEDKSAQATIAHFAPQLLKSLERIGIEGS